jgi:hypothetical protein
MSKLTEALKRKFKTPQAALAALGLDTKLLEAENIIASDSRLRRRLARDASPDDLSDLDADELIKRVMEFLRSRLDADDLQTVAQILDALDQIEGRGGSGDDYPPVNLPAQDRRRIALDARIRRAAAREDSFAARWPGAARIGFSF